MAKRAGDREPAVLPHLPTKTTPSGIPSNDSSFAMGKFSGAGCVRSGKFADDFATGRSNAKAKPGACGQAGEARRGKRSDWIAGRAYAQSNRLVK